MQPQQQMTAPILGFGPFRVFPFLPWPIAACRFLFEDSNDPLIEQSDITTAIAVEVWLVGGSPEPIELQGNESRAFIDWYLAISGERKVEPIHLA